MLATANSLALVVLVIRSVHLLRNRDFTVAAFLVTFGVVYLADLAWISYTHRVIVSYSEGFLQIDERSVLGASIQAWLFWLCLEVLLLLRRRSSALSPTEVPIGVWSVRRGGVLHYLTLSAAVTYFTLSVVREAGIERTLEARQAVFDGSFLASAAYFLTPTLVVAGYAMQYRLRGMSRAAVALAATACFFATALTGSRSGLFLSAALPVAALWAGTVKGAQALRARWTLGRVIALLAVVSAVVIASNWYLSVGRSIETDPGASPLDSLDFSQADVLCLLIQNDAGRVAATYGGALLSAVPRAIWPDKPLPGNVVASGILAPDRYQATGSEVAVGVLGEGYINAGDLAFLLSAILVASLAWLCSRLISRRADVVLLALGWCILLRGLNLIRGDLVNVIAPTVIAAVVWFALFRPPRSRPARPERSTGARGDRPASSNPKNTGWQSG